MNHRVKRQSGSQPGRGCGESVRRPGRGCPTQTGSPGRLGWSYIWGTRGIRIGKYREICCCLDMFTLHKHNPDPVCTLTQGVYYFSCLSVWEFNTSEMRIAIIQCMDADSRAVKNCARCGRAPCRNPNRQWTIVYRVKCMNSGGSSSGQGGPANSGECVI